MIASPEDAHLKLSISALRHYLECPLQGAARHALGMREEDDGDDAESDDEPLAQSRLETAILLRDALWRSRGLREEVEHCYDEAYRLRVLKGSAPVGPFAAAQRIDHLARLETGIGQAASVGVANLERWQRIAVGGVEEFIDVDRAVDPIVLEVDSTRGDGRRVAAIELRGAIGPVSPQLDKSIKLIARGEAKTMDFHEGGLAAIVLAAAGERMPAEFITVVAGGDNDEDTPAKFTRRFHLPNKVEARAYLAQLAVDLLSESNDYFLPFEAVEKVLRIKGDLTAVAIDKAVREIRDQRPPNCRSDYGPVRNAREYRVPLKEIKQGLIVRHYGPLMGIFARGKKGKTRAHD